SFCKYSHSANVQYYSWYPDPESIGVDAFTFKWENDVYAFPPFNLVGRTLRKFVTDNANGIVVNSPSVEKSSACSGPRITETLRAQKLPQNVIQLIASSCSKSTWNHYDSVYSKYAKSMVLVLGHPFIVRLLRGVGRLRPPLPRYQTTWDVLSFFETMRSPGVDAWLGDETRASNFLFYVFFEISASSVRCGSSLLRSNLRPSDSGSLIQSRLRCASATLKLA
ncbi:hypothetical protein Ocin01_16611, partial [Orchesella cincta]